MNHPCQWVSFPARSIPWPVEQTFSWFQFCFCFCFWQRVIKMGIKLEIFFKNNLRMHLCKRFLVKPLTQMQKHSYREENLVWTISLQFANCQTKRCLKAHSPFLLPVNGLILFLYNVWRVFPSLSFCKRKAGGSGGSQTLATEKGPLS